MGCGVKRSSPLEGVCEQGKGRSDPNFIIKEKLTQDQNGGGGAPPKKNDIGKEVYDVLRVNSGWSDIDTDGKRGGVIGDHGGREDLRKRVVAMEQNNRLWGGGGD